MGVLYLQQCACMFPARPEVVQELKQRAAAIKEWGGDYTLFDIPALRPGDEERIIGTFRDLRSKEYAEIIEECETKFVKEIEFEHFRQNYSYAETEEIRQDLDKIRRWHKSVVDRDWFGADKRGETEAWIERCAALLADFEQEVYRRQSGDLDDGFDLDLRPQVEMPGPVASADDLEPDEPEDIGEGEMDEQDEEPER